MSNSSLPPLQLIPEPISRLIRLFEEHAKVLQFPDVDASSLTSAVAEMDAQRLAVDEAAAALDQARENLAKTQQQLLDKARQAHAYASVYALADEEMQEKLAQIKMGAVQRTARKRKPIQREPGEPEGQAHASTTAPKKSKSRKATESERRESESDSRGHAENETAGSEPIAQTESIDPGEHEAAE